MANSFFFVRGRDFANWEIEIQHILQIVDRTWLDHVGTTFPLHLFLTVPDEATCSGTKWQHRSTTFTKGLASQLWSLKKTMEKQMWVKTQKLCACICI